MNSPTISARKTRGARHPGAGILVVVLLLLAMLALGFVVLDRILWGQPSPREPRTWCVANLKQIQGAKETWALEHHKLETDTPVEADLYGEGRDKYIRMKPVCPLGGVYTIGAVRDKPACSIAGHTFEQVNQSL